MVDHHESEHLGCVLGVIDHHITKKKFNYDFYLNHPLASTSLHIYHLMVKHDYPIAKEDIVLILLGVYTDTCSLRSSKARELDKVEALYLIRTYNLDEEVFIKGGLLLRDLSSMTIGSILSNGLKKYKFGKDVVYSIYLRVGTLDEFYSVKANLIAKVKQNLKEQYSTSWVFVVFALNKYKTLELTVKLNNINLLTFDGILSRGKDIIPRIERLYLVS